MPYVSGHRCRREFLGLVTTKRSHMYQGLDPWCSIRILGARVDAAKKDTYLPNMVSCEWTGTMTLTEPPHCGTDLGLMRTRHPTRDGKL